MRNQDNIPARADVTVKVSEDFLRQRGLPLWAPQHPALMRFKAKRCATLEQVRAWVDEERRRPKTNTSVKVSDRPCSSVPGSAELVANAALSLLNLACYFLDRQLAAQAAAFEKEGGFTERLYRVRTARRP